jgi:hypothetical protein
VPHQIPGIDFHDLLQLLTAAIGPLLPRECAATCPQLAKADATSAADPLVKPLRKGTADP